MLFFAKYHFYDIIEKLYFFIFYYMTDTMAGMPDAMAASVDGVQEVHEKLDEQFLAEL